MRPMPLVSVVIILFNAEQFIGDAVASVRGQLYDRWELLLVDDGSTDGSRVMARRYADADPARIRYLQHEGHENRGMSASRNLGVKHARGEYLAFLDADDVWLPQKLEEQVAILQSHPRAAMVYGRTLIWYNWTGKPEDAARDHTFDLGVPPNTLIEPPRLLVLLLENKVQTPTTCNAMMRRKVVLDVGGFEEAFRGMYEDQVLFAKIELHEPVFVAGACWAKYRQHPGAASARAVGEDYHAARRPFLTWVERYLSSQIPRRNGPAWEALRREWWPSVHPRLYRLSQRLRRMGRRLRRPRRAR